MYAFLKVILPQCTNLCVRVCAYVYMYKCLIKAEVLAQYTNLCVCIYIYIYIYIYACLYQCVQEAHTYTNYMYTHVCGHDIPQALAQTVQLRAVAQILVKCPSAPAAAH